MNRFSENLDFILKKSDTDFQLKPYLQALTSELHAYGYRIEIVDRSNTDITVRKAFIKDDSVGKLLQLNHAGRTGPLRKIRIKLEVDTNPPIGSGFEIKYIDFPFISSVTVQGKPSLFAGKIHALLCREYIKGRDWYDFLWYTSQKIKINYKFLSSALKQQGSWQGQDINTDLDWCINKLKDKIKSINWETTKDDVRKFVKVAEQPSIDIWNQNLFLAQLEKLE